MAEIRPFRGIRYNREEIEEIASVITLPYDKITPELQERYYNRHPYNYVRIVLPKEDNRYELAKERIEEWQKNRILIRDEKPAFYLYYQEFERDGRHLRKGLVAALRLEEFEKGIVLPHEKTLSKPKEDRLKMMRATRKNLGHVFMLYSDKEDRINRAFEHTTQRPPEIEVRDEFGITHRLWKEEDSEVIEEVKGLMRDKVLLIADGHHRYETSLSYRNEIKKTNPDPLAPFNYRMVTLVNLFDPGLLILPTHRLIFNLKELEMGRVLEEMGKYFHLEEIAAEKIKDRLKELASLHSFGMYTLQGSYLLTLKDESVLEEFVKNRSQEYRTLDVTILHSLIIENILGIPSEKVEEHIRYEREAGEAMEKVRKGEFQIAFLLNPTKATQVERVARQKERMPQKSTDFYPKLASGLTIFDLEEW